jgi:isopenicillin-N epimerase
MLAPKGAGFLYARKTVQRLIEPLVVSWGYCPDGAPTSGVQWIDYLEWMGTRDPSAALSVPAAIQFMNAYRWEQVRKTCNSLLRQTLDRLQELTRLPSAYREGALRSGQMAIAPLPGGIDPVELKERLYEEYCVEIPVTEWNGHLFLRISIQGYNTADDADRLVCALAQLLKMAGPGQPGV